MDSYDISSDSDGALDEIVVTPSTVDFFQYDLNSSPIHLCDNSIPSDDINSTNSRFNISCDEVETTISSNQLTTDSCTVASAAYKNSSSRRMEYSMRGTKLTGSNPSQDSAFGSMTDGEQSIASSSLRLNSFQSISSPIDEGVEEISNSVMELAATNLSASPSGDNVHHRRENLNIARSTSDSVTLLDRQKQHSAIETGLTLEPPKILVNDQSSFYTTSPSKTCATIEVFSQKYRV